MAGVSPLIFTTRGIPEQPRVRALRTLREQGLLPVEPLPDRAPDVALVKWRLPGASVLWGTFDGVRQVCEGESDPADDLFLGINLTGAGVARQRGREIEVEAGDAMAVGTQDGPFTVLRPVPSRLIGVRLPRRAVHVTASRCDDGALRLVPAQSPALQLLARYLRSLLGGPVPTSSRLADTVVSHVRELVALSLAGPEIDTWPPPDRSEDTNRAVRAARLSAIKSDIDWHLTDPGFTASAVAGRHGISTRYLHKLFELEGKTYSQYVLQRRLDLVHRNLLNPRLSARSIAAIAHDVGFGDLSYFNRTFRRHYGTTPSQARRQHLEVRRAPEGEAVT
jgi:AraC-like DNA-binding protein